MLDASLTESCPPLSRIDDGRADTLLRWIISAAEQHNDCASKHGRLVEAVR